MYCGKRCMDVGWKPSDMTQRNGRIIRQGNMNKEVKVFNYVTEGTFDSYLFQTLENKQRFISQIMTSKSPVRSCEDVDYFIILCQLHAFFYYFFGMIQTMSLVKSRILGKNVYFDIFT